MIKLASYHTVKNVIHCFILLYIYIDIVVLDIKQFEMRAIIYLIFADMHFTRYFPRHLKLASYFVGHVKHKK